MKQQSRVSPIKRLGRQRFTLKGVVENIKNISNADLILLMPKIGAILPNECYELNSAQANCKKLHEYGKHGRVAKKFNTLAKEI